MNCSGYETPSSAEKATPRFPPPARARTHSTAVDVSNSSTGYVQKDCKSGGELRLYHKAHASVTRKRWIAVRRRAIGDHIFEDDNLLFISAPQSPLWSQQAGLNQQQRRRRFALPAHSK